MRRALRHWPLWTSLVLLAAMLGVVAYVGYTRTGGTLTYALDDAYIHMSLAKNLARHGVMGATPFEFTSASSSPLWTFTLASVFAVFGVHDFIPLTMTVAISVALLVVSDWALRKLEVGAALRFVGLAWVAVGTPLAPIVFGGMEHPLQILIDVALLTLAAVILTREQPAWDRSAWAVVALAALASAVRYEGLVLVGIVAGLGLLRRRWTLAGAMLAAGAAPVVGYGLYSLANGGYFLPNPVLVKGATSSGVGLLLSDAAGYWALFLERWTTASPLYPLVIATGIVTVAQWARNRTPWLPATLFAGVVTAVSVVHLAFGDVGWFFRYEAYLVALLGLTLVVQAAWLLRAGIPAATAARVALVAALAIGLLGVGLCLRRASVGIRSTAQAVKNVHDQQYQMAHFLAANPHYDSVAIGDLGAVSYYNDDLRILDLEGLAETGEPLERLGREQLDAREIRELADRNGAQIAIIFPDYFDQPGEWVEVGSLTIENNLVAYGPTVVFLAIRPSAPTQLAEDMREYARTSLPDDVTMRFSPDLTP